MSISIPLRYIVIVLDWLRSITMEITIVNYIDSILDQLYHIIIFDIVNIVSIIILYSNFDGI